jgi:hypothetical protein
MNHQLIHQIHAVTAPWAALSLLLLGRNPRPGMRRKIASVLLASLLLLLIPVGGWNLASWFRVLEANPSVTLTGLLLVALAERLAGKKILRSQDWSAAWIFGAVAALVLYPMGLGLTRIDPYAWGWDRSLPVAVAAAATLLLLRGNRFGCILLLPYAGCLAGLQESTNFWDALIDPFYGTAALFLAAVMAVRRCSPLTSPPAVID